jgi:8-oxo-dGTP diphosphatase
MPRTVELSEDRVAEVLDVIVGIVCDTEGRVLIGQRPEGKHMAGHWEFPGGKLKAGETPLAGLQRELLEEVGIIAGLAEPFLRLTHRYSERTVRLDIWWVLGYEGEVTAREGQALRWVDLDELAAAPLLPADAPIVASIRRRLVSRARGKK